MHHNWWTDDDDDDESIISLYFYKCENAQAKVVLEQRTN